MTYLDVDEYGMVSPEAVYRAIREDTTLITIMFGNNEVGTIEPVFSIGKIAREKMYCSIRMLCRHMRRFRSPCVIIR